MSKRKQWSVESMRAAVKGVEEGMGLREAARLYNVPVETLRRRTIGNVDIDCKPGPSTVLTPHEERRLAQYCITMSDMGFGLTREDVMRTAFAIADASGRSHPFQNGLAGRAWFDAFCNRHPRLTLRKPEPLSYARAASCSEEKISDFFGKLGCICAKLNILSKPMQIYNVDETGVTIVQKPGKVVAELGKRCVWAITSAEKGKTHTVVACVSASGFSLPPMIVYPRKRIAESLKDGGVPGTLYSCSATGWINEQLFSQWFDFFIEKIPPVRPVLLIMDGHTSHISIDVIDKARANHVHLLGLPSHTTHLLQPLDVSVFKPFKSHFSKACKELVNKNPGRVVTTYDISGLIAKAWPLSLTPLNIMSGFKKCGIYPLNPGAITDRQLAPSRAVTPQEEDLSSSGSGSLKQSTGATLKSSDISTKTSDVSSSKSCSKLDEILSLPKARPKQRPTRPGLTTYSQVVSGSPFRSRLQESKSEKEKKARTAGGKQNKRSVAAKRRRVPATKRVDEVAKKVDQLDLGASEESHSGSVSDDIPCQECGTTRGGRWIGCDGCNSWFHIQCTECDPKDLPDMYFCKDCC